MTDLTRNGTLGRVYGGDCDLVHIADGQRANVGEQLAADIDAVIRSLAEKRGVNTDDRLLCPGCYMIALVNAAIALADANKQPRKELARSMANAFTQLAFDPDKGMSEEIEVILDND